jgi:glycosyltransferase involved in cell wall biosynthesis
MLDELEASGRLIARGVRDPLSVMEACSVFLMPSLHEGMGVALLEALSFGLPAIINDAPGLRWAADLPSVLAVPPAGDWAQALVKAADLRGNAQCVAEFSPEASVSKLRGVYEEAAHGMMEGAK